MFVQSDAYPRRSRGLAPVATTRSTANRETVRLSRIHLGDAIKIGMDANHHVVTTRSLGLLRREYNTSAQHHRDSNQTLSPEVERIVSVIEHAMKAQKLEAD